MMFSINYDYHHDEIQGMKFVMLFVNVKVALTNKFNQLWNNLLFCIDSLVKLIFFVYTKLNSK